MDIMAFDQNKVRVTSLSKTNTQFEVPKFHQKFCRKANGILNQKIISHMPHIVNMYDLLFQRIFI